MEQVNEAVVGPVTPRRARRSAQQWQALIEAQPSSGLGVEEYCDHHQLSASCFYRWRRCLSDAGGPCSPWSKRKGSASSPEGFAAVRVVPDRQPWVGGEVMRLTLCGGRELILPISMPVQRLAELLVTLERER